MNPRHLTIRPAAQDEIDHQVDYLAVHAGERTAGRFLSALAATLDRISKSPGGGGPWCSDHPHLQGIRKHAIDGFPRYLLYYRYDDRKLDVLHLFHGSQDIENCLEPGELGEPGAAESG